ncbi:T-cell immunoglobulin and mucin domain-containing protein 4-like isoform X2 [Arvicola amphibius]|uniref:T-cell immunoglobulin and mucin domain-containing protein 4-like isoform X2 n=1 Tax=Arvicola amphibius TaxID=1047088 RepID=UPI0018E2DAF8|nr:T-cell immunoglobulin and mucin domain-containing protein 4-like isoform X2 [Arvicola amphibius]
MSKELLLLSLVIELWGLYLTPAASQDTIIGILGQSVTLPCHHTSWSRHRNSMCWGKGACPNSKCNEELLHTDGKRMISRKSTKYTLQGIVWRGDVSLTITNTNQGDSGVYCCRIEVPGWFNDVKKTVRLELRRAPTTPRPTTTSSPTTTPYVTTITTEKLPTTVPTTPEPTTATPPQTLATTVLTTAVATCPSTILSSSSPETTRFATPEIFTEGSAFTTEPETVSSSNHSQRSMETRAVDPALLIPTAVTGSEPLGEKVASNQSDRQTNILIIACCVGFVLMVSLLLGFLLQGRVTEANCLQRHKRPDNTEDCKSVLNDMSHGRDDEDGIFTL